MKGYIKRILTIALIIVVFVVSFNVKLETSLDKTFRTIANSNKRSTDSCTTGDGTVYYVKANSLTIRNTNSTNGTQVGSALSKCTEVKVYCTNGGWARISKVSDKWVNLDSLSISRPTGCTDSSIISTTTDRITFGSVIRTYKAYGTSENDVKQMYRDKPGTIEMIVQNVTFMASDEQEKINVKITKGGTDVTSNFTITRSGIENGRIIFNLIMKPNIIYDEGQYNVTFSYSSASASSTFDLAGRFYHFTIDTEKTTGNAKNFINKQNIWKVSLNNLEPSDLASTKENTAKNFRLTVLDSRGNDASSHFKISYHAGYIEVENERTTKKPDPGQYQMLIKYINTTYTTARTDYKQTFDFAMGNRLIEFNEDSDLRTSYRYDRFDILEPYQIKVVRKDGSNIVIKEKNSNGTYSGEITLSPTDFADAYRDFNPLDITYGSNSRPVIVFEDVNITRFYNNSYTYVVNGTTKTSTAAALETAYPGITDVINQVDLKNSKKYTFDSNGYVEYNAQGSKTIHQKSLQIINKPILSSSGGIMNFVIDHVGLNSSDASVLPVITRDDGVVMKESDGFKIVSQRYEDIDAEDGGKMYLTIEYDNTDSDKYTKSYTVSYTLKDLPEKQEFVFTLSDGEIDYYLMSSYDGHLTDPFEAINTAPPGNKRYEYYLGFYLMKTGGLLLNYKPSTEMTYRVFTEQVDCEDNSSIASCERTKYYFKQVDYTLSIVKYINNQITFDVTFDTQANNRRYTLSVQEFKEKYYEVWDLFKYYTFDSSGNLNGNKYDLQVKKIYNGEENQAYVDFIPEGETEIVTKSIKEFSSLYPEYYVYVTNHFSTDANDNVVNGRLRGSYRIREENGVPIQGEEVTHLFDFTVDMDPYNVDRAITVLPATEVNAGTYYVYVGFEGRMGVGYTNNSNDPVITREQFPEMWNRSIHMSTIVYNDPVYDIEFKDAKYSNNQNTDILYANIPSKGIFEITTKYIFDYSGFSYHFERKNGSNWVNADNLFIASSSFSSNGSNITMSTIPGTTLGGDYRVVVEYNREGFSLKEPRVYEFNVNDKYYGIAFNNDPNADLTFVKNYKQTKELDAIGYYVTNIDNIKYRLVRRIDEDTVREFTWDKANKRFLYDGKVVFTYEVLTSLIDTTTLDYLVRLTNLKDAAEEGDYELTLSYNETGNEVVESTIKFNVTSEQYRFAVGKEERAKINSEGYSIQRDVYASFINYEDLDFIEYVIYYHVGGGQYMDVSSVDSTRRMFVISDNFSKTRFDQQYDGIEYEYKGLLNIAINEDLTDFNGQYYIRMKYDKKEDDYAFSTPSKLFDWSSELKINAQFNKDGENVPVEKFFLNVDDVTLTVDIKTPHEDMANYIVTSACLDGTCIPSQELNLNNRFNFIASESSASKIVLKYRTDLAESERLPKGTYALVVYYNNNDIDINTFEIVTEFADIKLDDVIMYSDISSSRQEPNLFKNKVGHIEIPVRVSGVAYNKTMVSITRNGTGDYSNAFTYNISKYETEHILDFTYNPNSGIEEGDYNIMVSYVNADGVTISDNVIVTLNKSYFTFEIGEPTYNPNPPIANADPYGEVIFDIATEDIPNISIPNGGDDSLTEKHVFASRAVITNTNNADVTSLFEVSARISTTSPANFNLVLKYMKNSIIPGVYNVRVSYSLNGYIMIKNAYFEIGDYEKDITVGDMEILTSTNDKRVHNNVGGIFKINYRSIYDIYVDDIAINVMNSSNNLVTDNFNIVKASNYINVELMPKTPALASGDYTINIIYTDPQTGKVKNHSLPITIYGSYKEIAIINMQGSTSKVYADLEDQYYTFELKTSNLSDEELNSLEVRVYDKNGNIVNSSIASDNVENVFDIVNEVKTNGYFKINIIEFKSPVGEYEVEVLSPNDENDYNVSNRLSFTIHSTAYRVRLSIDSKVIPSNIYNNDPSIFYDIDTVKVDYLFTSNYNLPDANYSLKVFKNGVLVKEITELNLSKINDFGIEYFNTKIDIGSLDAGVYEIAICLKGLPYESRTIEVLKYVPVTYVTLTNNGDIIKDTLSTNIGRTEEIGVYIEPRDATNKELEFISSDESIFTISNGVITPINEGTAKLIIRHRDYNGEITIEVSNRISSDTYNIDYEAKTIFVSRLKGDRLNANDFINNLAGLSSDYQIRNFSGDDIDPEMGLVGTKSTIISGGDSYTIILIGDIDGNGIVNLADANYIFRIYRGSFLADEYNSIAARVNKGETITMYDVNKVFRLYRGVIDEI